jgi:ubiquinone/menaquinone biosynthesis C-methylase UbiE
LAKGGEFSRVLGCDYSEAMLMEARRRIQAESSNISSGKSNTKLQLVRCDVGQIPMQTASVPAVHAGAAMHCWPDLPAALSEVYRVLQPGGRYFASTFLSSYFRTLQLSSSSTDIQSQAFQYFESTDMIQSLLVQAGFESDNIQIEILGNACIIIRCEK